MLLYYSDGIWLPFQRSLGENVDTTENKATIDFSGENGRVVSDPLEILRVQSEMAFEIPKAVKRRSVGANPAVQPHLESEYDYLHKNIWYHGKLDREQAIMKLKKYGGKEG